MPRAILSPEQKLGPVGRNDAPVFVGKEHTGQVAPPVLLQRIKADGHKDDAHHIRIPELGRGEIEHALGDTIPKHTTARSQRPVGRTFHEGRGKDIWWNSLADRGQQCPVRSQQSRSQRAGFIRGTQQHLFGARTAFFCVSPVHIGMVSHQNRKFAVALKLDHQTIRSQ